MQAYEAGINLAKTEFFDKVAAYGSKRYAKPKPKGPKDTSKGTKKVAAPKQNKQVDAPAPSVREVKRTPRKSVQKAPPPIVTV